jgi:hypothetical protein
MISGLTTFTLFHVLLSLIGIVAGFAVLRGLLTSNPMNRWTQVFFITTWATVLTGFLFPFNGFTPALAVGILSTVVLAAATAARYLFNYEGAWRWIYVAATVLSFYFNFFVLVVQAFLRIPALHAFAPNGNEPPFAITQGVVLLLFVVAAVQSVRRFHPAAVQPVVAQAR